MDGIRTLLDALGTALSDRWALLYARLGAILSALDGVAPPEGGSGTDIVAAVGELKDAIQADNVIISGQLDQIKDLIGDYVIPWEENIFYALRDMLNFMESGSGVTLPPLPTTDPIAGGALGEHCQRVQWMIDFYFDDWLKKVGDTVKVAGDAAIAIGLAALTVSSAGIGAIPLSLLTSGFIAARAARDEGVGGLQTQMTSPRRAVLRNALYSSVTAESAQAAWYAAIDTMTDVNEAYRLCWKAFIWSTWFNDLYDPTNHNNTTEPPLWNLSGYSDAVCSFVGTIDLLIDSDVMTTTDGAVTFNMIEWPSGIFSPLGEFSTPALSPSRDNSWKAAPIGTTITVVSVASGHVDVLGQGGSTQSLGVGDTFTCPVIFPNLICWNVIGSGGGAFTIRVVVPL